MEWTSERAETAGDALDRVGADSFSNMSFKIAADDGCAWIIVDPNVEDGRAPPIACQAIDRVLKNLESKFGRGLVEDTELVPDKKSVTHLLKHSSGNYVAIGEVCGAFRLWASLSKSIGWLSDLTESDVFAREILGLVSDLWAGVVYAERQRAPAH